jgi:hypothetical protein
MARTVDLIWIPGLCAAWLDQEPWSTLTGHATARATLQCGFPAVPAAVEATALSGVAPGRHGCLGATPLADRPLPQAGILTTWPEIGIHRDATLWAQLCRHGPSSDAAREALREAHQRWSTLVATASSDHAVIIASGPGYRAHDRRRIVDLSGLPMAAAVTEGGILRVAGPAPDLRDALLRTPGVERVLVGRGLALWGADHPQAGDLVAVAEPTWSFTDEAIAYGSLEEQPAAPVLMAFGGQPRWPADVHDVRIAPTLARAVGRPLEGFADAPLEL